MWNEEAPGGLALGLSVGATNLAAGGDGHTAAVRPAEVTLRGQRVTGFIDRVGDPVPLIAGDGSSHRPEALLAAALDALADSATEGSPASDVTVAVPSHWRPPVADALRRAMPGRAIVSDATAAVTALSADPGLPTRGVVVLCDFGGSGSSITLINASSHYGVVGETVRYTDFSGDQIDQALLTRLVAHTSQASDTAMVGSLTRLRGECRDAKERLSAQTATAVAGIRITRTELEDLIDGPFAGFLAALDDTLQRYGVPHAGVTAVATIGGGARIPLVTQLLSEHLRAPVVTTAYPQLTAAQGAALIGARRRLVEPATTVAPAAEAPSPEFRPLAWSQVDSPVDAPVDELELPYAPAAEHRPALHFHRQDPQEDDAPPRRSPLVLFGLSAAAAVITTAVFGFMQFGADTATPVEAATTIAPSPAPAAPAPTPAPPAPQATHPTTVVVQRANPVQQPQRPQAAPAAPAAPAQPVAPAPPPPPPPASTTEPPTTTPSSTPPTTTPPSTAPSTPPSAPPSTPPSTPPSAPPSAPPSTPSTDPGSGDGGLEPVTETAPSPADPGALDP